LALSADRRRSALGASAHRSRAEGAGGRRRKVVSQLAAETGTRLVAVQTATNVAGLTSISAEIVPRKAVDALGRRKRSAKLASLHGTGRAIGAIQVEPALAHRTHATLGTGNAGRSGRTASRARCIIQVVPSCTLHTGGRINAENTVWLGSRACHTAIARKNVPSRAGSADCARCAEPASIQQTAKRACAVAQVIAQSASGADRTGVTVAAPNEH